MRCQLYCTYSTGSSSNKILFILLVTIIIFQVQPICNKDASQKPENGDSCYPHAKEPHIVTYRFTVHFITLASGVTTDPEFVILAYLMICCHSFTLRFHMHASGGFLSTMCITEIANSVKK